MISPSKDAVSFSSFNAAVLELPTGMFDGPLERKTVKFKKGDTVPASMLTTLVAQAVK